jgi:hypothetical protein
MLLALLITLAIVMTAILGRSVWSMSRRSSAVKRRAAVVFAGREPLASTGFGALFPASVQSIAKRLHDILQNVLIVDVRFVRPQDRLISDLGLGQVDGLEPYHLNGYVESEYRTSLLPLFETTPDPSVADVVQYLAEKTTTTNATQPSRGVGRFKSFPSPGCSVRSTTKRDVR